MKHDLIQRIVLRKKFLGAKAPLELAHAKNNNDNETENFGMT